MKVSKSIKFFLIPHLSQMQNRVEVRAASCIQNKNFHTTQWQLTHPTAKFLSQIVQTHSFKFRDNTDKNEPRRWLQKTEDNQTWFKMQRKIPLPPPHPQKRNLTTQRYSFLRFHSEWGVYPFRDCSHIHRNKRSDMLSHNTTKCPFVNEVSSSAQF